MRLALCNSMVCLHSSGVVRTGVDQYSSHPGIALRVKFCFKTGVDMRFAKKVAVYVLRPIYRAFFERPLWWFLAKVKIFFISDMAAQVQSMERRLREDYQQRLTAIEERLRAAEQNNLVQWDALEQLLLALFHQPQLRTMARNGESDAPREMPVLTVNPVNRTHAASNIR